MRRVSAVSTSSAEKGSSIQQNIGMDHKRPGKSDALAHAARTIPWGTLTSKPSRPMRSIAFKARRRAFFTGHFSSAQAKFDIGEHREPGEQGEALEHHGDAIDGTFDGWPR